MKVISNFTYYFVNPEEKVSISVHATGLAEAKEKAYKALGSNDTALRLQDVCEIEPTVFEQEPVVALAQLTNKPQDGRTVKVTK